MRTILGYLRGRCPSAPSSEPSRGSLWPPWSRPSVLPLALANAGVEQAPRVKGSVERGNTGLRKRLGHRRPRFGDRPLSLRLLRRAGTRRRPGPRLHRRLDSVRTRAAEWLLRRRCAGLNRCPGREHHRLGAVAAFSVGSKYRGAAPRKPGSDARVPEATLPACASHDLYRCASLTQRRPAALAMARAKPGSDPPCRGRRVRPSDHQNPGRPPTSTSASRRLPASSGASRTDVARTRRSHLSSAFRPTHYSDNPAASRASFALSIPVRSHRPCQSRIREDHRQAVHLDRCVAELASRPLRRAPFATTMCQVAAQILDQLRPSSANVSIQLLVVVA